MRIASVFALLILVLQAKAQRLDYLEIDRYGVRRFEIQFEVFKVELSQSYRHIRVMDRPGMYYFDGDVISHAEMNDGNYLYFEHNGNQMTSIRDNYGNSIHFEYADNGFLTRIHDSNGGVLSLNYDGGRLTSVLRHSSEELGFWYNGDEMAGARREGGIMHLSSDATGFNQVLGSLPNLHYSLIMN